LMMVVVWLLSNLKAASMLVLPMRCHRLQERRLPKA
jgi:hypothetical protein